MIAVPGSIYSKQLKTMKVHLCLMVLKRTLTGEMTGLSNPIDGCVCVHVGVWGWVDVWVFMCVHVFLHM